MPCRPRGRWERLVKAAIAARAPRVWRLACVRGFTKLAGVVPSQSRSVSPSFLTYLLTYSRTVSK